MNTDRHGWRPIRVYLCLSMVRDSEDSLVPTRCVGTRKLRAAQSIRLVSTIAYTREPNLPAVRHYPVRPGRRLL